MAMFVSEGEFRTANSGSSDGPMKFATKSSLRPLVRVVSGPNPITSATCRECDARWDWGPAGVPEDFTHEHLAGWNA